MENQDPLSTAIFARLGELPSALFPAPFIAAVGKVEAYGQAWALELAHRLRLEPHLAAGTTASELIRDLALIPRFEMAVGWLLDSLVNAAWCCRAEGRVTLAAPLPQANLAALRREVLALDEAHAATLDLLDAAGEAFAPVGRGERKGEDVLLGPAGIGLWSRYFANHNALYAINNQVVALAAGNRVPMEGPYRMLEVGAGGGSGAEALLDVLDEQGKLPRLEHYLVTEPSQFFRRRSQRSLSAAWPGLPLGFGDLDIDRPWQEQGVEPESTDLVFGVNVLHVAKDLPFSLREAHRCLRPGGCLVIGECVRPYPGRAIAAELVFGLLEGFTGVELDGERRPNAGFLTADQWRQSLLAAGFAEVTPVPEVEAIAELTPNFLTAALCARRGNV